MKNIFLVAIIIAFSYSLNAQNPLDNIDFKTVSDLDFGVFNSKKYKDYYNKKYDDTYFLEQFYKAWDSNKNTVISEEDWNTYFSYFEISKRSSCYAGNYQVYSKDFIDKLRNNIPSNKKKYPHFVQKAMTIATVDLRVLPTYEFCLKNMRNAGEGYPFDYFQNSTIWTGTPILILSKTKDNLWFFVSTPNNKGWVESNKIAFVTSKQIKQVKKMALGAILKDDLRIQNNWHQEVLHIGVLLPITDNTKERQLLIPQKNKDDNYLILKPFTITTDCVQVFPVTFNKTNVKNILANMWGKKYSWGGLGGGRDCSSTLKDYLTPFGIWLPRNSFQQSQSGKAITLLKNKKRTIIEKGIPFLSAIYKRGHIVLYVGLDKKRQRPLIYQTVWGIKGYYKNSALMEISQQRERFGVFGISQGNTSDKTVQTRFIIGKTVITNLDPTTNFNMKGFQVTSFLDHFETLTLLSDKTGLNK